MGKGPRGKRSIAADGLLICSPEYAHGVAGVMKNALDWLVGGSEFVGKPVLCPGEDGIVKRILRKENNRQNGTPHWRYCFETVALPTDSNQRFE